MCQVMLSGKDGSQIKIKYKDSLGNYGNLTFFRNYYLFNSWFNYNPNDTLTPVKWKKWNCNVGYVNMGNIMTSDV